MKTQLKSGFEVSTAMEVNENIELVHQYVIWWHTNNRNSIYLMQSDFIYLSSESAMTAGLQKIEELCTQSIQEINFIRNEKETK